MKGRSILPGPGHCLWIKVGEYREYLTDEQRSLSGWIGIRMPSYL